MRFRRVGFGRVRGRRGAGGPAAKSWTTASSAPTTPAPAAGAGAEKVGNVVATGEEEAFEEVVEGVEDEEEDAEGDEGCGGGEWEG